MTKTPPPWPLRRLARRTGLPRNVAALDIGSSNRSGLAALAAACRSADTIAVAAADMRFGQPNSPDEAQGADAGAAFVVGEDSVIAEFLGSAAVTEELVDRWRIPGETRTRQWEERFGETRYGAIGLEILDALQDQLGLSRGEIAHLVITGQSPRAVATMTKRVGASADVVTSSIGNSGCVLASLFQVPGMAWIAERRTTSTARASPGLVACSQSSRGVEVWFCWLTIG